MVKACKCCFEARFFLNFPLDCHSIDSQMIHCNLIEPLIATVDGGSII